MGEAPVNFVFDNADINGHTLIGHGVWHALGGIAAVKPAGNYTEPDLTHTRLMPVVILLECHYRATGK